MAHIEEFRGDIVHLGRLALEGKQEDVRIILSRLSRKLKIKDEELSSELAKLVKKHSPLIEKSTFRKASLNETSTSNDDLIENEVKDLLLTPDLSNVKKPILNNKIELTLNQLFKERTKLEELKSAGLNHTKSAIFTGPPGVGKTHTAKWIAKHLKLPLYVLDVATIMSSLLGKTGSNFKEVLNFAKNTPCVLLLDEIDAIAKRRDDNTDVGELKRLVTVMLQEIDQWNSPSLLLAATNHKELIDSALWRRFDLIMFFDLPTSESTQKAIERFLGSDIKIFKKHIEILKYSHKNMSLSDVQKSIEKLRRANFLELNSVEKLVEQLACEHLLSLSKEDKKNAAIAFSKTNLLSQRKIAELTGIHRDTIRKITK